MKLYQRACFFKLLGITRAIKYGVTKKILIFKINISYN